MPTLVRLLTILAAMAGTVFAIMAALVFFVEPTPRMVTVEVPIPQFATGSTQRAPKAGSPAPVGSSPVEAGTLPPAAPDAAEALAP